MASARFGSVLSRASNCLHSCSVLKENVYSSSVLVNYQQTRGRRRAGSPPSWFVRVKPLSCDVNLTKENKTFLQDLAVENLNSPLRDEPWERAEYTKKTMRTGVLALKIGVIPQWTREGRKFYTTLLQVLDNHVIRYTPPHEFQHTAGWRPSWKTKYGSLVVGALSSDPNQHSRAYNSLFTEAGVPPKRKLTRFLITDDAKIQPGTPLNVMHFRVGDYVDCQAQTIDYGFQGVVKRWRMKGMPASHGVTKAHRKMGGIGGGGDKSGIWKGKKMPGHMGNDWKTLRGLRIWRINTKYNILYVHSQNIPGANHTYVRVMDTKLPTRKPETSPPMPTWFTEDTEDDLPFEFFHEKLFEFTDPSIEFEEEGK